MQLLKRKQEVKAPDPPEEGIPLHVDATETTKTAEEQPQPPKVSNKRGPRIRHEEGELVAIRVNILEATRRKLGAAAQADAVKFAVIVERALASYTAPIPAPKTLEEELVRLLPQIDRNLFFKLDGYRSQHRTGWGQFLYQGLELLRRELDGEPLRADPPRSIVPRPSQEDSGVRRAAS